MLFEKYLHQIIVAHVKPHLLHKYEENIEYKSQSFSWDFLTQFHCNLCRTSMLQCINYLYRIFREVCEIHRANFENKFLRNLQI